MVSYVAEYLRVCREVTAQRLVIKRVRDDVIDGASHHQGQGVWFFLDLADLQIVVNVPDSLRTVRVHDDGQEVLVVQVSLGLEQDRFA